MNGSRLSNPVRAGMIAPLAYLILAAAACGGDGSGGASGETAAATAQPTAGDESATAARSEGEKVAGTITANFDGEPRTWYAVTGSSAEGGRWSTGTVSLVGEPLAEQVPNEPLAQVRGDTIVAEGLFESPGRDEYVWGRLRVTCP